MFSVFSYSSFIFVLCDMFTLCCATCVLSIVLTTDFPSFALIVCFCCMFVFSCYIHVCNFMNTIVVSVFFKGFFYLGWFSCLCRSSLPCTYKDCSLKNLMYQYTKLCLQQSSDLWVWRIQFCHKASKSKMLICPTSQCL